MTYRTLFAGTLLAGLVFWASAAVTVGADRPAKGDRKARMLERHPEADANQDGQLSDEEIKDFLKNRQPPRDGMGYGPGPGGPGHYGWKGDPENLLKTNPEADTDGDGKLSREEHRAFMESRRAEMTKELLKAHPELDKDGNGELSLEERKAGRETIEAFMRTQMSARILAAHPEADTNGDGKLSQEEFAAIRRGGPGPGPGHPGFSPGEMLRWLINNFDKVDANGDGQLSKEELTQFKDSMPAFGPGGPKGLGPHKEKGVKDSDSKKEKGQQGEHKHRKGKAKDVNTESESE